MQKEIADVLVWPKDFLWIYEVRNGNMKREDIDKIQAQWFC